MKKLISNYREPLFENQQFSHLQELFYLWEPFSFELDYIFYIFLKTETLNNSLKRKKIIQKNLVGS